jgi:uncharacterized protein
MKILISGSTGLIGSEVVRLLRSAGHEAIPLRRSPPGAAGRVPSETATGGTSSRPDDRFWDPQRGICDRREISGFDAVIHLSGENLGRRWTPQRKRRIVQSRVDSTRLLAATLSSMEEKPSVLICASAMGYYGKRERDAVTDESPPGKGFLPALVRDWEAAAAPARGAGIRVVHLRSGLVLSPRGGTLPRFLLPFRLGLGGPVGDPRAPLSWITLDDAAAAIVFLLSDTSLDGPVNITSPNPTTNGEFARVLAGVLHRPALLPVPPFALRLLFGQMAEETILAGARVLPARLLFRGFRFSHPELDAALRHLLAPAG